MRMLTEEERAILLQELGCGQFVRSTPEAVAAAERLVSQGRMVWVDYPKDKRFVMAAKTDAGIRALRIDALIRQWGFGS